MWRQKASRRSLVEGKFLVILAESGSPGNEKIWLLAFKRFLHPVFQIKKKNRYLQNFSVNRRDMNKIKL